MELRFRFRLLTRSLVAWQAWPTAGQLTKDTSEDIMYMNVLGDKSYMMGVSPWFYTSMFQFPAESSTLF
jgi:hypothetical protein